MSKERKEPEDVRQLTPGEAFGFTRQEQLFDRVCHERLLALLDDDTTTVHRVELSSNAYGEFLFVTLSRPSATRRIWVTFYGGGYHEYRERWLIDDWFWYVANARAEEQQSIPNNEARKLVQQRVATIQGDAQRATQTRHGALFEMIADLSDDDGALAEMQDLGDLWDRLAGE